MINWNLSSNTWDENEIVAIQRVIQSGMYTMGNEVKAFETQLANIYGVKHAIMTNSGSSANLIMMAALAEDKRFNTKETKGFFGSTRRKNVIVPAVSWSTTFFPVHQLGFDLKFVDVDPYTMNISTREVEEAIDTDTVAVLAVNLLGAPADLIELKRICNRYEIQLLEDNCESFGAMVNINGSHKLAGTFGLMGTLSFFFSHHLQTMEGGCVLTDDDTLADYLKSLRAHGWVRDLSEHSNLYQKTGDEFNDSFHFVLPGYCVRPLEFSGAVGQEQLKKWPDMMKIRRQNAYIAKEYLNTTGTDLQSEGDDCSSWFGFGIQLRGRLEGRRDEVIERLKEEGVQTRPVVAGNFTKNPVMSRLNHLPLEEYPNADYIDQNGFFLGNDCICLKDKIIQVSKIFREM